MLCIFLLALAVVNVANAEATWHYTGVTNVTSMLGISTLSDTTVYGAITDESFGPGVIVSTDAGATSNFYGPAGSLINLDIAINNADEGVVVGLGKIFVTKDGGKTLTDYPLLGAAQSVSSFGDHSFGVAGYFTNSKGHTNGVSVSVDGGDTFTNYDSGLVYGVNDVRYASFPAKDTWYLSAGSWHSSTTLSENQHTVTSRLIVDKKSGESKWLERSKSSTDVESGAIAKTTDGGKTFRTVYNTDKYYFNAIDCIDTETCTAVMENGEEAYALMTTDGGKNWNIVLKDDDSTLMCVKMISKEEAWVAGGRGYGPERYGHFWHTTDGGRNWVQNLVEGGICTDIGFADGSAVGYASVSTMVGYSMVTFS